MEELEDFDPIFLTKQQVIRLFKNVEPSIQASQKLSQLEQRLSNEKSARKSLQREIQEIHNHATLLSHENQYTNWKQVVLLLDSQCQRLRNKCIFQKQDHQAKISILTSQLQDIEKQIQQEKYLCQNYSLEQLMVCQSKIIDKLNDLKKFKIKNLEKTMKTQIQINKLCISCGKEPRNVLVKPCRHVSLCTTCVYKADICPMCQVFIMSYENVFIS